MIKQRRLIKAEDATVEQSLAAALQSGDIKADLEVLPLLLSQAEDPTTEWLRALRRCRTTGLQYPEAGTELSCLARAIADVATDDLTAQCLRDQMSKSLGTPKRWADSHIRNRSQELRRQRERARAELAASLPPPTTEQLEAERLQREQEQAAKAAAAPFRVLGWDAQRQRIWFQHRETAQIASVNPGPSFDRLVPLAPLEYWESTYPDFRSGGADWQRAVSDLATAADRAGVFDPRRKRGRGVWLDQERVVWHLGDRLEVDGVITRLVDLESHFTYARLPGLAIDPQTAHLSDQEGNKLLSVIGQMGWVGANDHLLLAGWIVLSNVGGALRKRPGLQITSGFGTGKSDAVDNVIRPLQAALGISTSGSTEAGIRQSVGNDVLPVLVDESEAADGSRREQQLRLVRLSYDGQPLIKGTPGGEALEFTVRSSFCMAGINAPITNPADLSRIAVIGRQAIGDKQWAAVTAARAELFTVETGQALIRRTVTNLPVLMANIATIGKVLAGMVQGRGGGRMGDTYGALLAGCHLLTSTERLTPKSALEWLDAIGWNPDAPAADAVDRSAMAEARQCLDHLLSAELPWHDPDRDHASTGRITIRELLALALRNGSNAAPKALGQRGLKADPERGLVVANSGAAIEKLFAGTKWNSGGHRARLLELDGVEALPSPQRVAVHGTCRCICVPWALVEPAEA